MDVRQKMRITGQWPIPVERRWTEAKDVFDSIQGRLIQNAPHLRFALGRTNRWIRLIAATLVALALFSNVGRRHPKPQPQAPPVIPPRFFCSTWAGATPIPQDLFDTLYPEYRYWVRNESTQPRLTPEHHKIEDVEASNVEVEAPLKSRVVTKSESQPEVRANEWQKPPGVKVVALIFFGRPHQVDLLDCYLQQNMAYNGGYLDEVHFIEHTTNMKDLQWLHNLVSSTPAYKALEVGPDCRHHPHAEECRYERIWEHFATDPDTIYIKMDDDIVYIHEDTIPRLVHRRIEYAQPFAISANIVNSPLTAWMHYRLGAVYPYLPEPAPVPRPGNPQTWRASELPKHPYDADYADLAFEPTPDQAMLNSAIHDDDQLWRLFDEVPYPGHRWLPLTQNTTSLLYTPISRISANPWGVGVHHWALAAQQHYSLLKNIEDGTMYRYHMASVPPHGEGLFNPQYSRYNLNFIAVWGSDIVKGAKVRHQQTTDGHGNQQTILISEMHDDEKNITADMPRNLGRPMVIDVQAVVAHMHFHDQEPFIQMTDLLDRWRAYVNDKVCASTRQKKVPGQLDGLGYNLLNHHHGMWQCPWVTSEHNTSVFQ